MKRNPGYIKQLLKAYMEGRASDDERRFLKEEIAYYSDEELVNLISQLEPGLQLKDVYDPAFWKRRTLEMLKSVESTKEKREANEPGIERVLSGEAAGVEVLRRGTKADTTPGREPAKVYRMWYYISAAGVFFLLLGAFIWWNSIPSGTLSYICDGDADQRKPRAYQVLLTVEESNNPCSIVIDSGRTGIVLDHRMVTVSRRPNGTLIYQPKFRRLPEGDLPVYNTLVIPEGGFCAILLPDSSRLILMGASQARFPLVFPDSLRKVFVEGLAYFEVRKKEGAAFKVETRDAGLEALGTRFKISTLRQQTVAMLLSGALQVSGKTDSVLLKAGQQAVVPGVDSGNRLTMSPIRVLKFDSTQLWPGMGLRYTEVPLNKFLEAMGKRYGVEMVNLPVVSRRRFTGVLCNDTELADILQVLRLQGIKFRQEGNRIIFAE